MKAMYINRNICTFLKKWSKTLTNRNNKNNNTIYSSNELHNITRVY